MNSKAKKLLAIFAVVGGAYYYGSTEQAQENRDELIKQEQSDRLFYWGDYAIAKDVAKDTERPLWVHFTKGADCAPCESLRRVVYPDPRNITASKRFVCVCVNVDETPGHAAIAECGVDRSQGLPQDVFFLPSEVGKSQGHRVLPDNIPCTDAAAHAAYLENVTTHLLKVNQ